MKLSEAITKYGDRILNPDFSFIAHEAGDEIVEEKPKLKKIDLSRLIESGIDCEFWDTHDLEGEGYAMSPLLNINRYK